MSYLNLPLAVTGSRLSRVDDVKASIDKHLSLILHTAEGDCRCMPKFGFRFNNLRFEIINERDGVVYDSAPSKTANAGLYDKKISGTSTNLNTFAAELLSAIAQYESRLTDITVGMSYLRQEHRIHIVVNAVIAENRTPYKFESDMKIWN